MAGPQVALATCRRLHDPDPDAAILEDALEDAGIRASHLAWDDPDADWSTPVMCVLRSTWNYHEQLESFLAWANRVSRRCSLWNPYDVVRWNVHKRYLETLARRGVAAVPTVYVRSGETTRLADVSDAKGWRRVVIKPEVSAASADTYVMHRDEIGEAEEELFRELLTTKEMMVQPYIDAVDGSGERAVVWIAGEITHSVRKSPRFSGEEEAVSDALPAADDERALALAALELADAPLLYGRVDMVRDDRGEPMVMELELVEPSLFLFRSRPACDRLVAAIGSRLGRLPR